MKSRSDRYFVRPFDQSNPGLILVLLDQSSSMATEVGGVPKSQIAASAINKTLETLIERCKRGAAILDKAYVGVIGYGMEMRYELMNSISELNEQFSRMATEKAEVSTPTGPKVLDVEHKVWIEPRSENTTPMAEALDMAADRLQEWVDKYPEAPPPVVINVTDGAPNDLQNDGDGSATRAAAGQLRTLGSGIERCLLLSVHIASDVSASTLFPTDRRQVKGRYQELLFDISSVLPEPLLELATRKGLGVREGSRLIAINASPNDLLRVLDFGSTVSMHQEDLN